MAALNAYQDMAFEKFKTDRRLWFWFTLVLFVIPWFMPLGDLKGSRFPFVIYIAGIFLDPGHFEKCFVAAGACSLLFGIPAISIGWVVQCIVAIIRDAKRKKIQNAE
jgi:hypothetical protein